MGEKKRESFASKFGLGKCPDCGKIRFTTRKAARQRGKQLCPGEQISAYRCGDYFHWGHTPYGVKRGMSPRG